MSKILLDTDTGECLAEINEGDRILRKKSLDYLSELKSGIIQEWKMESFFKGYIPELKEMMRLLTNNEAGFVAKTIFNIGYADCCLKDDLDNPLSQVKLAEICGLSERQTRRVMDALIKKGVLYKGEDSKENQYFVNPWLFCKGNIINSVLKTMFRNYGIKVLGGRQWKTAKNASPQNIHKYINKTVH